MKIEILDLGMNNISSVSRAFSRDNLGDISVITVASESKDPDLYVLPGLGHFDKGVQALDQRGFRELLVNGQKSNKGVVGICLGMQLLSNQSAESPGALGLGLIPGICKKLPTSEGERIPNIGWNSTKVNGQEELFPTLNSGRDFYFVHSFYVETKNPENILSTTQFGTTEFASSIKFGSTVGFQFHPEKSADAGRSLIREVIQWAKREI